jgi:hypothetical protein
MLVPDEVETRSLVRERADCEQRIRARLHWCRSRRNTTGRRTGESDRAYEKESQAGRATGKAGQCHLLRYQRGVGPEHRAEGVNLEFQT